MANTFKVVSHDVMPDTAGTPEALYTTPSGTTTVVLGLILCNIDASQRLVDVKLVSDTTGGGRTEDNTTLLGFEKLQEMHKQNHEKYVSSS